MARVALCQDVATEYMGFMSIAAVLKRAGHAVEVFIEFSSEDRLLEEVEAFRPDIVGFSVLTPSRPWALRVAARVKERTGALTVLGNVEAMLNPEIIEEPGVDMVCLGEGERPMAELASRIDGGRDHGDIDGIWVKTPRGIVRNGLPPRLLDPDALPFHDRSIYDKYPLFRHSRYLRILNGRGCPFRCSFCLNPVLRKHLGPRGFVRKRRPEAAIREIEYQVRRRPRKVGFIFFVDEVMWVENGWLREFLRLYRDRVRIPFIGNFRHGPIGEEEIRLLRDAGAYAMILAVESGDETQRRRLMKKGVSDRAILRVSRLLHKFGIRIVSSCFFGIPGDTVRDHVERLPFFRAVDPDYLWTTFFAPYPHLELTAHPIVQAHLPEGKPFRPTLHHDIYLDVPDKARLVRLKKVYHPCMRFPRLSPLLVGLTRFPVPLLFDLIFSCHFFAYALRFERVSFRQLLEHVKLFVLKPFLRR